MKLIFVEGPPGSGKTTYAHKITKRLEKKYNVKFFGEHSPEGIDISCQAYLSNKEFVNFLNKFDRINKSKYKSIIFKNTRFLNNKYCLVSYSYLQSSDYQIKNKLEYLYDKEISNRGFDLKIYYEILEIIWNDFFQRNNLEYDCLIFESALIQTHLFNLKGYYNASDDECINFIRKLLKLIDGFVEYEIHITYSKDYPSKEVIANKYNSDNNSWEIGFERWLLNAPCIVPNTGILDFCNQCNKVYFKILKDLSFKTIEIKKE